MKAAAPAILIFFCVLCALCGFVPVSRASEIIRGYAPQDGQQLYAEDLDNLIDESTIGVQFFNDQQTTPVLGAGYYILVLNPANETYYRINAQQVLYGNTNMFLNPPQEPAPAYGLMLFCDPSNNWVASTTVSNFLWNSASNINVAGLLFANSNNAGATNAYVLPRWPYPVSGLNTNYPFHFLVFDTNGIPYRAGLSNLEQNVAGDFGTDFALPYEYRQEFQPWTLYGTNTAAPYTNAFGYPTNFPITALNMLNNGAVTNLPALTDTDTIPVNAFAMGVSGSGTPTNTSATLFSLYQYMTNKNALPPYTMARCQFSGIYASAVTPGGQGITNMDPSSGIITNIALAENWSNAPVAVSFQGASSQLPTSPVVTSNTMYWAYQTNWPNLAFQLFTNYASAVLRTNPITGNGVSPVHAGTLLWLTNYTSVNCEPIQLSSGTSIGTGWYGIYFLTPASPQTPYYYLSGSAMSPAGTFDGVALSYLNDGTYSMIGTNGFWMIAAQNENGVNAPLVQVLVSPQ